MKGRLPGEHSNVGKGDSELKVLNNILSVVPLFKILISPISQKLAMAPLQSVRLLLFRPVPGTGLETKVVSLSISPYALPKHHTMQKIV